MQAEEGEAGGGRKFWYVAFTLLVVFAAYTGSKLTRYELQKEEAASTLFGWDTSFNYFWLRSIALDGDVDFSNDIRKSDTLPETEKDYALNRIPKTEQGLVPNKYPVGWAILYAPWFAMGHMTALVLDSQGVEVNVDGFGRMYEVFLYAGSVFYAALSLWLTYLLLCRFFERHIAYASLALVWAASFLIFYQLRQYAMAHGVTYLCVVSCFYWALAIREMPPLLRNWAMLGISVGLLAATRYQAVVYLLFPFCIAAAELLTRRAPIRAAFICLSALAVPVFLQLLGWKLLYGSWYLYTYSGEGFLWSEPKLLKTLFDPNHGLIYWHPIFAFGLVGMCVFALWKRIEWGWTWIVSALVMWYVNAAWHCWWFGVSFGNRAYEGVILFVFFGIAMLLKAVQPTPVFVRGGVYVLLFALAIWNLGIMEATMYSWITGVGLEGAESLGDLARAVGQKWFGIGAER